MRTFVIGIEAACLLLKAETVEEAKTESLSRLRSYTGDPDAGDKIDFIRELDFDECFLIDMNNQELIEL